MASSLAVLRSPSGFIPSPNWLSEILGQDVFQQILRNNYHHELEAVVEEQSFASPRNSYSSFNFGGFGNMTSRIPSLSSSSSSSSSTWSSSSDPSSPVSERSTSSTSTSISSSSSESEPPVLNNVAQLPDKLDDKEPTHAGEIRKVFQKLDQNDDGLICAEDLVRFTERLGFDMSMDDAISLVESVDHNRDGRLDFGEFYSLYESLNEKAIRGVKTDEADEEDDTLLQAFQVFDKNHDGYITVEELQTVLRDLGLPEGNSLKCCTRMIQRISSESKDRIDLKEFKAMMCSKSFPI